MFLMQHWLLFLNWHGVNQILAVPPNSVDEKEDDDIGSWSHKRQFSFLKESSFAYFFITDVDPSSQSYRHVKKGI